VEFGVGHGLEGDETVVEPKLDLTLPAALEVPPDPGLEESLGGGVELVVGDAAVFDRHNEGGGVEEVGAALGVGSGVTEGREEDAHADSITQIRASVKYPIPWSAAPRPGQDLVDGAHADPAFRTGAGVDDLHRRFLDVGDGSAPRALLDVESAENIPPVRRTVEEATPTPLEPEKRCRDKADAQTMQKQDRFHWGEQVHWSVAGEE
jgi:hypothetical protein